VGVDGGGASEPGPERPDAEDVVDAPVSWSPGLLPGLVLWLDAGKGIVPTDGSRVNLWRDQSPEQNHARQTTLAAMPILAASQIQGLPAVTFDGMATVLSIADATSLEWGVGDYALFAVARSNSTDADRMLYLKSAFDFPYSGPSLILGPNYGTTSAAQLAMQDDANDYALSSVGGYNDNAFRLFGGRRAGLTVEARVNGVVVGSTTERVNVNVDARNRTANIGNHGYDNAPPGFQSLKGAIAEIVAIKGPITDADLATLESYLMTKYGLRLALP